MRLRQEKEKKHGCRNGSRARFRLWCPQGRVGSSPTSCTNMLILNESGENKIAIDTLRVKYIRDDGDDLATVYLSDDEDVEIDYSEFGSFERLIEIFTENQELASVKQGRPIRI
jgi:hypothetical protein